MIEVVETMNLPITKQLRADVRKLWKARGHLRMEIVAFFLFLPGFLLMIGLSIFELEKVFFF